MSRASDTRFLQPEKRAESINSPRGSNQILLLLLLLSAASHVRATQCAAAATHTAGALLGKKEPTRVHVFGMRPGRGRKETSGAGPEVG